MEKSLEKNLILKLLKLTLKIIVASEELFDFNYGGAENSIRFRTDPEFYKLFDKDAKN